MILGEYILTDKGWKTVNDLNIEDKVFDSNGSLINIIYLSDVISKKCFKIRFDTNETFICSEDNNWLVYTNKKNKTLNTKQIKKHIDLKVRSSYNLIKIKNTKPLNLPDIELLLDPYLVGIWLGDGHSIDGKITQANNHVWKEIEKRGYKIGDDISGGGCGKASTRTIFGISKYLRKLNLLNNKYLPISYLLSSYAQRLDLLRGLMDSDGYYNKTRKRYSISTTRWNQVLFASEIISSLGLKPTIIRYIKKINGKIVKCFNVEYTTYEFNPFLCRNKDIVLNKTKNNCSYRIITNIEEIGYLDTRKIITNSDSVLIGKNLLVSSI